MTKKNKKGFGILEVLIVSAILSISMISIMTAFTFYIKEGLKTTRKIQAAYILEEGAEAIRFLRDESFSSNITTLATGSTYYIATSTLGWMTAPTPTIFFEDFILTVELEDVYRKDSDSDIAPISYIGAKTLDPSIKKVTLMTDWVTASSTMVTYIADLFDN